jgi:ketosteroid isomerase-like protein
MFDPHPEFIVRAYLTAWMSHDPEQALSYLSDDVVWRMYLDTDVVTFGGETIGVEAMRQRMYELRHQFELLSFLFENISLVGQTARVMIYADYRHKATGRVLDLKIRAVFTVVGKQIVRCDEYHDEPRIRAFMELVRSTASGA